jgi:18S rRNA (guanine1575-N7)-methyltransferase
MLDVGIDEGNCEGNALLGDVGQGLPLVDQCVDGVISVSAVQWLCNADTSASDPRKRLLTFFRELYRVLQRGCRAALQFYPASESQANLIVKQAIRAGFSGGIVVDFPNSTKAKKQFLVITAGAADPAKTQQAVKQQQQQQQQQKGQDDGEDEEQMQVVGGGADVESMQVEVGKRELTANGNEQKHEKEKKGKKPKAGKQWVLKKKERHKRVGKEVKSDSKYSGRKRKRKPI